MQDTPEVPCVAEAVVLGISRSGGNVLPEADGVEARFWNLGCRNVVRPPKAAFAAADVRGLEAGRSARNDDRRRSRTLSVAEKADVVARKRRTAWQRCTYAPIELVHGLPCPA